MLEYLEAKYPDVSLLPKGPDKINDALIAKKVEVVADTKIILEYDGISVKRIVRHAVELKRLKCKSEWSLRSDIGCVL